MTKKVLVTGAGGFIVEEALRRGYDVWAAVRATTSREFLKDSRINFVELDFTDGDKFKSTIEAQLRQHGAWDYVVHNLGATKCVNFNDFNRVNSVVCGCLSTRCARSMPCRRIRYDEFDGSARCGR